MWSISHTIHDTYMFAIKHNTDLLYPVVILKVTRLLIAGDKCKYPSITRAECSPLHLRLCCAISENKEQLYTWNLPGKSVGENMCVSVSVIKLPLACLLDCHFQTDERKGICHNNHPWSVSVRETAGVKGHRNHSMPPESHAELKTFIRTDTRLGWPNRSTRGTWEALTGSFSKNVGFQNKLITYEFITSSKRWGNLSLFLLWAVIVTKWLR